MINDIAHKHHIVKIKTIGDSLLFAAGLTDENRTNPIDAMVASREMLEAVRVSSFDLNNRKPFWELSIGVHTGPVSAEPTGKKNNPFNLLGESVNIAYRLCRICDTGKVSLSAMTFEMVKEFYETNQWGKLPVKYKGAIDVFHLDGINKELSIDGFGKEASKAFQIKYGLIQFMDIQENLLDRLERHLPKNLYYHSVKHTIDVVTEVELLAWSEKRSEEEILILKLAGLFHDCGHMVSYQNHEFYGAEIAREVLSQYNYTSEQIEEICRLIMATKFPPEPKDKLEEVMCDSDLDYLGRSDFVPVSNTLYQELKERDMIGSFDDWNKLQLAFIKKHQYYTKTARNLREVNKQSQINRIMGLLQHDSDMVKSKDY
jgi:adenylate cyclase